jgi:glutamate/tyrosine decarboxylase-like PLP-dependent enzyme
MFTYEMAPCYTLMEGEVYEYLRKRIGCKGIDGMMTPSGSFANWNGMLLACYYKFPGSKIKRIKDLPKTKIITSAASHYSVEKVQS